MKREIKSQRTFIASVFIWSFFFWALGIFLSLKGNVTILENADLLGALLDGTLSRPLYTVAIINTLAGFGPLLGAAYIYIFMPEARRHFKNKFKCKTPLKYTLQIIALFFFITLVPTIPLVIRDGLASPLTWSSVGFFFLFLIYQFITAGTEEIGWRGYLLPSMLKEKTPWQASVRIGVIWALWHTPIIWYVFYSQGIPFFQTLLSFMGFIAGTIAMSTVHTYYYLKTKNIFFSMFIHSISNAFPMFLGMLVANSYMISVVVQILLWVFVMIITKKNKLLFDTIQEH